MTDFLKQIIQAAPATAKEDGTPYGSLAAAKAEVNPAHMKIIRDRFFRNFDKAEVEDAIITDTSGAGKAPSGHFHVRFHIRDDYNQTMTPYQRLVFMGQETDRGKFILSQLGLTYHDEANFEKYKGILQYDCDFGDPMVDRGNRMRAVQADLDRGIEEAKAARNQQLSVV